MAIVKQDHNLQVTKFIYDETTGDVIDIELTVNYQLFDDVQNEEVIRVVETKSVWDDLNLGDQTLLNQHGKKLKNLGEMF